MEVQDVVLIMKDGVMTILAISAPMIIGALVIGFMVALFQATTQINEPTMAFVPKIIVVFLALVFFGPWILTRITQFTLELYESILRMIV
ncbi:MAG: flagellar biosynthesis protein FliQ [Bacillota bacterium]|nr:flagellar biosynthesis protein FliQ [Bacillota bacterium]